MNAFRESALRREGFEGQHMAVLPRPLWSQSRRHPLLRGLCVTDAGYFPHARLHRVERPQGAPTTLVILCLGGAGWVRGEDAAIGAGRLLWLPAGEAHAYGASGRDPWTIIWAHFTGEEVEAWRDLLGLRGPGRPLGLDLPPDRLGEVELDRVYAALEGGQALRHQVAAAAALRHAFGAAASLCATSGGARSARERVAASAERLRVEWQRPHRLEELAKAAGLSVAHYSALFRQHTGFSPVDFLIRLRIRQACRLFDTTALPVGEVAARAGYADAYYFSRCFRRVMGCSPRAYRRMPKG